MTMAVGSMGAAKVKTLVFYRPWASEGITQAGSGSVGRGGERLCETEHGKLHMNDLRQKPTGNNLRIKMYAVILYLLL